MYACLAGITAAAALGLAVAGRRCRLRGAGPARLLPRPGLPDHHGDRAAADHAGLVPTAIGVMNAGSVIGGSALPWLAGAIAQAAGIGRCCRSSWRWPWPSSPSGGRSPPGSGSPPPTREPGPPTRSANSASRLGNPGRAARSGLSSPGIRSRRTHSWHHLRKWPGGGVGAAPTTRPRGQRGQRHGDAGIHAAAAQAAPESAPPASSSGMAQHAAQASPARPARLDGSTWRARSASGRHQGLRRWWRTGSGSTAGRRRRPGRRSRRRRPRAACADDLQVGDLRLDLGELGLRAGLQAGRRAAVPVPARSSRPATSSRVKPSRCAALMTRSTVTASAG